MSNPGAILPQLPFSWDAVPKFDLQADSTFSRTIREEGRPPPAPAYRWFDSITASINAASDSIEAVSLVELTREVRPYCITRYEFGSMGGSPPRQGSIRSI